MLEITETSAGRFHQEIHSHCYQPLQGFYYLSVLPATYQINNLFLFRSIWHMLRKHLLHMFSVRRIIVLD